jgi:hypothetical protein
MYRYASHVQLPILLISLLGKADSVPELTGDKMGVVTGGARGSASYQPTSFYCWLI